MKIVAPDYYPAFACMKGECRHSCCIGWEIDIDPDQLDFYKGVGGSFGARLAGSIVEDENGAHFRLDADERCPFLNSDGLCDMILELGGDALCQICADHPRFRNFFSDHEEIGLGLCCDAAAQLILTRKAPVKWIVLQDDGEDVSCDDFEQDLIDLRDALISVLQDRKLPFRKRMEEMLKCACLPFPVCFDDGWVDFFLTLERLDVHWGELLEGLRGRTSACDAELDSAFEQLAVYLLQRHLPGALYDDDLSGRIVFTALIVDLLRKLCSVCANPNPDSLAELARMYSSEIEYSDENIDAILTRIHEVYPEI